MERYLARHIRADLAKKMVFLAGPRQVGKTTLAKSLLASPKNYLLWDSDSARTRILDKEIPSKGIVVFDELHKFKKWRAYLKGIFDTRNQSLHILVTGSAKLDFYRYGGDSLQGRYYFWRLHPFSVAELGIKNKKDLESLFLLGGFPEPFLSGSQREARRWSREYRARLIRDEVNSLEQVSDLASMEVLYSHLPNTIGSPLSINSLREQLQVSHQTTSSWLTILENTYGFFRIPPFGAPKIRAVKKEQKAYLFDWSTIQNEGAKFENFIACHLLKYVHYLQDYEGLDIELRYYRDTTPREVDFILLKDKTPWKAVECKLSDPGISPSLKYFKAKFPDCICEQVHLRAYKNYISTDGIQVRDALSFLSELI